MSERATRHLDENGHPDDDRYATEWSMCQPCKGFGAFPNRMDLDEDEYSTCPSCDGAGELVDR